MVFPRIFNALVVKLVKNIAKQGVLSASYNAIEAFQA
jgi:hypothetical protein